MRHNKRHSSSLKKVEPLPLPPSLEAAFEAVENLNVVHPTSRGNTYGTGLAECCRRSEIAQEWPLMTDKER